MNTIQQRKEYNALQVSWDFCQVCSIASIQISIALLVTLVILVNSSCVFFTGFFSYKDFLPKFSK